MPSIIFSADALLGRKQKITSAFQVLFSCENENERSSTYLTWPNTDRVCIFIVQNIIFNRVGTANTILKAKKNNIVETINKLTTNKENVF